MTYEERLQKFAELGAEMPPEDDEDEGDDTLGDGTPYEQELQALYNEHEEMLSMIGKLYICLGEHLKNEAEEKKVPVEELCPCMAGEMKEAKKLIDRIEGR